MTMDENREATTARAALISGEEFVRQEPALAAVLADMALAAVRRQQQEQATAAGQTSEPVKKAPADRDEHK